MQHMTADARLHSQLEQRFYTGIWLGKDAQTNESILGIPAKIVRACTIRRQVEPEKYNRQLIDTAYIYPWNATWTVAAQYKRRYRIWKNRTLRCRMLRVYIQV